MERSLTHRQAVILDFVEESIKRDGYPPTRAEIAKHFGFRSPNAAEEHLRALAGKGRIEIRRGIARGIVLTPDPAEDWLVDSLAWIGAR